MELKKSMAAGLNKPVKKGAGVKLLGKKWNCLSELPVHLKCS